MASAGTAYVDVEARTDTVADAIQSVLDSVDGTVEVTADVSDAEAAIAAVSDDQLSLFVDADMSAAESELDKLEASPVEVPVDADTVPAQGEIDSLDGGEPVVKEVKADTDEAQKSIDDLSGSIGALGDVAGVSGGALGGFTDDLGSLAGVSGGAALALGGAVGAFGMTVSAAADAQVVVSQTDSILESLGDSAVVTGDHIAELSQRVMEYSGFSDEAVQSGANTLLMFDQIQSAEVFDRAIESAADLAVKMGTDVPSAARALATVLSDPEGGMGRLKRQVGDLTDAQKEQVAAFMAVGDVAGAQKVILDSLDGSIGNLAEDYGQTLTGSMDRARESMDELAESTGQSMLPVMESLADLAGPIGEWTQKFHDATGNLAMGPISGITGTIEALSGAGIQLHGVGTLIGELPPGLQDTAAAADAAASEMQDFTAAMSDYLDEVVNIPSSQRDVQESITDMVSTMQDSESTWFDMADAQDSVITNTADLITNLRDNGASQAELDGAIQNTIGMLRAERDAGHITKEKFRELRDEILGIPHKASTVVTTPGLTEGISNADKFAEKAKQIDKLNPSTSFSAPGLSDAYSKSLNYLSTLQSMDGKVITTTFKTIGSPVGKYASGTESAVPGLALVGEQGPELVAFGGGERVLTATQTAATMSAGSPVAGASIVVNVHGTATAQDGQAVVDALRRWQQRNGPVPVRVNG